MGRIAEWIVTPTIVLKGSASAPDRNKFVIKKSRQY